MSLLNLGFKFTVEASELVTAENDLGVTGLVMRRDIRISSDHEPTDSLFARVGHAAATAFAADITAAVARLEASVKRRG